MMSIPNTCLERKLLVSAIPTGMFIGFLGLFFGKTNVSNASELKNEGLRALRESDCTPPPIRLGKVPEQAMPMALVRRRN